MNHLDVVRGAIARPPSGFALEQLARAEQVIAMARDVRDNPTDLVAHLQLSAALDRLDRAVSPSKERESSDVSVVRS